MSIDVAGLLALAVREARSAAGLEDAMAAYARGRYTQAESLLRAAADAGDGHAQELLGFMHAIGPDLYPGVWRNLASAQAWFERAARSGRAAARYMQVAFERYGTLEVRAEIIACFDLAAGQPPVNPVDR
jgi:TPR repeat protein